MANSATGESVIGRVVRILAAFSRDSPDHSLSSLARAADFPLTTTHRLTEELLKDGLLERHKDGRLSTGMRMWELASRGSKALALRQAAMPYLEDIHAIIRQHTQLGVLVQDEVLFIERLSMRGSGRNFAEIAGCLPLHASSSGLILLAFKDADFQERYLTRPLKPYASRTITDPDLLRRQLADIRREEYVVSPATVDELAAGIAVPIFGAQPEIIAALSAVVPVEDESLG